MRIHNGHQVFAPRRLGCAVLVLGFAASAALADKAEKEIADVLADMDAGLSARNTEQVLAHFSDHYLSDQPPMTKGDMRTKLKELCIASTRLSSKHEIVGQTVQGNHAVVVAKVTLTRGMPGAEDVESVSTVRYRLTRGDQGWHIVTRAALEDDVATPKPGGELRVPDFGVVVKLPDAWTPTMLESVPPGGKQPAVLNLDSPCLGATMQVSVIGLPMQLEAKQIAEMCSDHLKSLCPDAKMRDAEIEKTVQVKSKGDKTTGCCEIRMVWEQPKSDLAEFNEIVVRKRGQDLVVFQLQVPQREHVKVFQADFDRLVSGMSFDEPTATDPARGVVKDAVYENGVFGVRIEFPNDWDVSTARTFDFSVNAKSPCGHGSIMFAAIKLPVALSAKRALDGDESVIAEYDASYRRLDRSTTFLANRKWEESHSLTGKGDSQRKRWRMYSVDNGTLYFFVCDVNPPDQFDDFEPMFKKAVNTLVLTAPTIDRDGGEAATFANPPKK